MRGLACLAALILTGCASGYPKIASGPLRPGEGMILGSISQTDWNANARHRTTVYAVKAGQRHHTIWRVLSEAPVASVMVSTPGRLNPTEFRDTNGHVFAIRLPQGDYEFLGFDFSVNQNSKAAWSFVDDRPVAFRVEAGKAAYIGNIHLDISKGRNFLGINTYFPGALTITDRSDRDLPILMQRLPELSMQPVDRQIPDDRAWRFTLSDVRIDGVLNQPVFGRP